MSEMFVRVSELLSGARMDMSQEVSRFLDTGFVRISKTAERIYIIACGVSDYGSLKVTRRDSRKAVCIGNYVATGVFPANLAGKRLEVFKCLYQGHHAIYFNIR